jgi:hypothetical protein
VVDDAIGFVSNRTNEMLKPPQVIAMNTKSARRRARRANWRNSIGHN